MLQALAALAMAATSPRRLARAADPLMLLEKRAGGRLGVHAIDTGSGRAVSHRADERFGLCSTFKLPLAAVVLREIEAGRLDPAQWIAFDERDLVPHAPVTSKHLAAGGMNVLALAEAAQKTSDNVAANLLLARLGGPAGFTATLRTLGDDTTRIDRIEPELNLVPAGEVRDTTTPRAMAGLVARLFGTELLGERSRLTLRRWMIDTTTGLRRLRAGLPRDWIAGDKTGTGIAPGMPNKHNDVAIAWPPGRPAIVIAAYYDAPAHYPRMRAEDDAVLAEAAREIAGPFG